MVRARDQFLAQVSERIGMTEEYNVNLGFCYSLRVENIYIEKMMLL